MLKKTLKRILNEEIGDKMFLNENIVVSEELDYHIKNGINLSENIFRIYSNSFFKLINEVRDLYYNGLINLCQDDEWLVESDLGKYVTSKNGEKIWLDAPIEINEPILEALHRGKNVRLNSPFRTPGGPKKFAVYVKTPGGNVKKVTFGDPNLRVRNANKARAKSFRARHNCDEKRDKTKAGYWACNVSRYRKKLGLKSSRSW